MNLITGAGRSGTKYMSTALKMCGMDMPHERLGKDGIVSSFYCFDTSYYPGKHPVPRPDFDLILHQVREPLASIASIQTGHSWKWTCQFLPVDEGAPLLTKCAYNWLVFNVGAERQARHTYRIEALEDEWPILQEIIGFDAPYSTVADLSRTIHSREHDDVTWRDVKRAAPEIYDSIREAGRRYGYC